MSTFLRDQQSTRGLPEDFAKDVGIDGIMALLKMMIGLVNYICVHKRKIGISLFHVHHLFSFT